MLDTDESQIKCLIVFFLEENLCFLSVDQRL